LVTMWAAASRLDWHGKNFSADLELNLEFGLFAFLVSTLLGNLLVYIADFYHNKSIRPPSAAQRARTASLSESDSKRCYSRMGVALRHFSDVPTYHLAPLCLLTAACMVAASLFTTFQMVLQGVPDQTLAVPELEAVSHFSVFSFAFQISSTKQGDFGMMLLQATFLCTTFVIPIVLILGLLSLWVIPLPPKWQNRLLQTCHALDSWVALDVLVVVLAVAALDFQKLTWYAVRNGFMSQTCSEIDRSGTDHPSCLQASVRLCPGFIVLVIAAIATQVIPQVVLRACRKASSQRDEAAARAHASTALAAAAAAIACV
jgi:hypothetical protein